MTTNLKETAMSDVRSSVPRAWAVGWISVAIVACVAGLTSCGGGEAAPAVPPVILAESADVGASIRSDEWEVTLLDLPHKDEIVGDESEKGIELITEYEVAARDAQGIWLIANVSLTNVGEDNMILDKTIQVMDDQGREFPLGDRLVHYSQVWIADGERWGDRAHQLSQNVQLAGQVREGPLVYDVPIDATGLRLVLKGTEDSLDLGF